MFGKAVIAQIKLLMRQKEAIITFCILLAMCLFNYAGNVLAFRGYDLIEMYHPMKLLLLSYNRVNYSADNTLFFMQLYPLLVICPSGFSFIKEQQTKQESLLAARTGLSTYRWSKVIASFVVTFIIFTVPFLVEMALNCIAFPLEATGDLLNMGFYSAEYMESVHNYVWHTLFMKSSYLYTLLCILLFGAVTGLLGTVIVVLTFLIRVRYKVLLFIPMYVLLNATLYIESMFPGINTGWCNYMLLFCDENRNYSYFLITLFFCILFVIGGTIYSSKKELL
ncbi:MAG: hypothetical protein NC094_13710 [Bacteroidales bacterium]|nr:hypothetical protein [Lachnoclostridium sp.]MCM1385592.1 hypothetical protein [Lachnoclostridium sp.]MCM1466457.1 hypothetical protein [Bacteroidales bacterium]